ncbi:hypothetical protein AVEN_142235-1 [Araneus ventricosus]|uniref:Uncharacterized protein n=1 Tax=Araneus ventricosus TaxID=182803 RepID=A0A4Y2PVW2_ARAVE|nr:hypothetical protein AVEN_142235-1 [Araneus ventricosus]
MVHSSASHRWYTPPDGTFKCEPPVVHAAQWCIQLRATGGTRTRWYIQLQATYATLKCESPVVQAAGWYFQVRATGGTRRPMVHSSACHRWYKLPDGISKCEPPLEDTT